MRTHRGTFWPAVGATLVVVASTSSVGAQAPGGAVLHYRAPAGCPDEAAVRSEIESLLGRSWGAIDPGVVVDAEIRREDDAWVLRLRSGEDAQRDIAGESCAALAQVTALMVAWMIDPAADPEPPVVPVRTETSARASEPAAALDLPEAPAPIAIASRIAHRSSLARGLADPDAAPPSPVMPVSVGFGPTFVVDVGTLPSVSPGVGAELVVRIDRLDLRARGGWIAPQRATLENAPVPAGAGADIEWAGGSLHGCGRPFDAAGPGLSICGGLHGGALLARSSGVSSPGSGAIPTFALGVGAVLPWAPIPELDLELGVELVVPFATPPFVIGAGATGADYPVFASAPVSGRLTITGHIDVR